MRDFFFESLAIQRIELVARLVTNERCSSDDRELALAWIAEMTSKILSDINDAEGTVEFLRLGK